MARASFFYSSALPTDLTRLSVLSRVQAVADLLPEVHHLALGSRGACPVITFAHTRCGANNSTFTLGFALVY